MKMKKLAICGLCGALALSSFVGCNTTTATTDTNASTVSAESAEKTVTTDSLSDHINIKKSNSNTDSKEETVYVFCNADGQVTKTIVSEKLHNASRADEIADESSLKEIENLTGDEEYVENADGSITWKANGADITYQGTTDAKVPVEMKVTYYLDGKETKPEDMAGKSGKVKIRFEYTNTKTGSIDVNGTKKTVAVPFTVITGMDLDKDKFSNIEVENGTITDGINGNMVIGLTMPGLKDSLELSLGGEKLDLDFPEYFEVTADTTDFEIDSIMTMVSSGLTSNLDVDGADGLNLDGKMNELQDASSALIDGTGELADGTKQLYDNIPALTDGVDQLDKGANDLKDGANQLDGGIGQLQSTVNDKLVPGVDNLKDGSAQLAAGVDTLAATLGNMEGAIATAKTDVIAQVDAGLAEKGITYDTLPQAIEGAEAKRDAAIDAMGTDVGTVVAAGLMAPEDAAALDPAALANYAAEARPGVANKVKEANAQIAQLYAVKYQTEGALKALDSIGAQLGGSSAEGLNALVQGAHQLDAGLGDLQNGMGQLQEGVNELKGGSAQLVAGTTTLKDGTGEFQSKARTLADGVGTLRDGAEELRNGMTQFDEEGIQSIVDLVDVDAKEVTDTIKGIADLGESYTSFAGKSEDREGSCVFIFKLDGISAK